MPLRIATPPPNLRPPTPVKKAVKTKKLTKGSPKRSHKKPALSPRTHRVLNFSLMPHLYLPSDGDDTDSDDDLATYKKKKKKKGKKSTGEARALNAVDHTRPGWQKLGTSSTAEIFRVFEDYVRNFTFYFFSLAHLSLSSQRNDYTPREYQMADKLVAQQLLGHPCDRPKDIRARPFILSWINDTRSTPARYIKDPRPVFRVVMKCIGNCEDGEVAGQATRSDSSDNSDKDDTTDSSSSDSSSSQHDSPTASDSESKAPRKPRAQTAVSEKASKRKCPHEVILHVRASHPSYTSSQRVIPRSRSCQMILILPTYIKSIYIGLRWQQTLKSPLIFANVSWSSPV